MWSDAARQASILAREAHAHEHLGEQWFGHYKLGRQRMTTGPHASREMAKAAAFAHPRAKSISTGRGYGGGSDIQFHSPVSLSGRPMR